MRIYTVYTFDIRDDVEQDILQYCLWASGAKPLTLRIFNGKPIEQYTIEKGPKEVEVFVKLMCKHGYFPTVTTKLISKNDKKVLWTKTRTKRK